jgi:Family of unknown function (DUF6527)
MRFSQLTPRFVETIPETIEPGILYVSMSLASSIHLCACGCGQEVITPLSPTDWKLYYDGENVSLEPSIGNWGFTCRSHYWLRGGKVRWSESMSVSQVEGGRVRDQQLKSDYYESKRVTPERLPDVNQEESSPPQQAWLARFWTGLRGRRSNAKGSPQEE